MLAHGRSGAEGRSLLAALAVISVFMVVEFVGGILSGSLALIADASHMMTDAVALALAASAQWLSMKPADGRLHFGYRRFQVLAAFVNGIALVLLMAWIVWEAIQRSITPIAVSWQPMLVIAGIGLVANVVVFRMLHGSAAHNINVRGAMLHVIGDLLGSIAAVAAALVIAISGWTRIDPLLSMVVALLIGYSAYRLLRETAHILLEGAPAGIDANEVAVELASLSPDIEDVHGVQLWQITPEHPLATMHVRIRNPASAQETLALIKARLAERYGIRESTIQIETGCCDQDLHAPPSEHERGDNSEPDHAAIRPSRVGNLRVV
ncbi:MAG: cation diffusion facilitator family transporter [Parvularculaceae bacterium]|nr:cation diffusion facilitator family transporter [Parvularculaceae bacterium]